ncbi:phosphomannomutase/phosphoglucomutase [Spiribacter vilamensis]|uniref:phosphomannomutase n=1 Tax=Spiribacter vilamensis TaxID=531306 RepID=A0A4V2GJ87_9GAMM|nr:phosphomannomutase/phosphoglucomutase [Spiribacter vilamensis]RZU99325.1 phosphomannomutase [Spiribacter vilamensis]TVO61691.1 phosphomannomutase/phosphoglucomutase [Spiribacter vilamensis]
MTIDASILRAYDIRGRVDQELTETTVRALGQAIGSAAADAGQTAVVVGYDGRESSPRLAASLRAGLVSAGREVIDIGQVPTPVMYFATHWLGTQAGVVVTGSHNPPEYNGLKTIIDGRPLWGEGIQALGRRIEHGELAQGNGHERRASVVADYKRRISGEIQLQRPLNVVVDCGNGIPGAVAPAVLEAIGARVIPLFCDVDGRFPNHHPDPTVPENLDDLIRAVAEHEADVGLALDGDGDRLGVVDETGHIIWADRQMMLYAAAILADRPGEGIVFDVKCSGRLAEVIERAGGEAIMWKTGHSLIKEKLRETGAPLAGEMSGHLFFNDRWYGFDDGIYAAARLLEILAADPRPTSAIFAELPEPVTTPEIRMDLQEGEPHRLMTALMERAQAFEDAAITTIDGLRVDFDDGWGLVRASNTQPCLVMRFEGTDDAALMRIRERFEALIRTSAEATGIIV